MTAQDGKQSPALSAGPAITQVEIEGRSHRLELKPSGDGGSWAVTLDGQPLEVEACLLQPGVLSLIIRGRAYRCILDQSPIETAVQVGGRRFPFRVEDPRSLSARRGKGSATGGKQTIKAPMPGRVVRILIETGDQVAAHQGVIVIEAMKMQNELKASRAGKVVEVRVNAGSTVAAGEALILIE